MKRISIDVMVNHGRTFYTNLKVDVPTLPFIVDGEMSDLIDLNALDELVLQKCPTLKHEDYRILFNK